MNSSESKNANHNEAYSEQEKLSCIIEGTQAGTWEWNVQTGETRFNKRWAEIVGYKLSELEPTSIETWGRLTHPADLAQSNKALQEHFEGLLPFYECQARMKHKDGHWVWVQDRGKVTSRTTDGKPLWMFGTHIEITQEKQIQEIKEKSLEQLQALAKHVPGVLYQFVLSCDGSAHYAYVSENLMDIFGCDPALAVMDASAVMAKIHPEDLPSVRAAIEASASSLEPFHQKFRIIHPVKGERWISAKSTPKKGENGDTIWHGYSFDVTAEHDSDEELRVAAEVFTQSREAILIADKQFVIIECNASFSRITGYTAISTRGLTIDFLEASADHDRLFTQIYEELKQKDHWQGELMCRHQSGAAYAALASINAVKNNKNEVTHYVAIFSDISGIKQTQQELMRYANYDVLTGLPNRRLLNDRLNQALKQALRTDGHLAVCMLDLDGFKAVNDAYGHDAGDRLLQEVAHRLTNSLRSDDTIARLGGDEFVLILRDQGTTKAYERILHAIHLPITIATDTAVEISASIGVSYLQSRPVDGSTLLREADQALYRAKKSGRNQFFIFAQTASSPRN